MDSKLQDILILASRLEDKGGDLRTLLRDDPASQPHVYRYLNNIDFLRGWPLPPSMGAGAAKQRLLAQLASPRLGSRLQRFPAAPHVAGAVVSFILLVASGLSVPAATNRLDLAASFNGVLDTLGISNGLSDVIPPGHETPLEVAPTAPAFDSGHRGAPHLADV